MGAPPRKVLWTPNPGPQTSFLASTAKRALYGGAAGGGKSAALFALPLRWIANPRYRGLYLRREAQYLGDAIDKTRRIYPQTGARLVLGPRIVWTWPSGAELWLNHCAHENDVANYDSFEFAEVLFDELTHFTERQFTGICARLRGTDPALPYWARAATNPGGEGHAWVQKRWGAWLDPKHPRRAAPGEHRWVLRGREVPEGTPHALSYTFIPALLKDNPHVGAEYRAQVEDIGDPVRRAQLLDGNWDAKPEGALWRWEVIEQSRVAAAPPLRVSAVFVDPNAATQATAANCDDAGIVAIGKGFDGRGYVLEDASGQMSVADWSHQALALYRRHACSYIGAEGNLARGMVERAIRAALLEEAQATGKPPEHVEVRLLSVRGEKAQRSATARQLYPHLVSHVGVHTRLEDSMTTHDYGSTKRSAGDLDALSLGCADLLLNAAPSEAAPPPRLVSRAARGAGW